jgi:DNA polymerase
MLVKGTAMRIVALDFETEFSDVYSLKKLSTEAYVRDSRFEALGAAIKWGPDHAARWYDARQLKQVLADEDWSETAIICHHVQFDGFILSHHFGVSPRLWLCTLSMARLLLGNHLSVSLDNVRTTFNLPNKRTPYEKFKGKHWRELDQATQEELAEGCCDEVESIWTIFGKLAASFPAEEYQIVDLTVRMFTEPVLRADVELLGKIWSEENVRKRERLDGLCVSAADLQSSDKFAQLLANEGVEIAYKSGKNGLIPAFAKTDEFMRELLEDDDDRVRALAEARLGIKSTLLQTRAETLGFMASRGPLAVYLRYCGAHTTRWSGGDSSNFQNFKRGSDIRRAIMAPEGYLLVTVDLSQIECRILNYLAGQEDVIERFRAGADPYVGIASEFYGRSITKADSAERGTGKQAELSCGFGCGSAKFKGVARLGIYGPPVHLSDEDSQRAVDLYRRTHPQVVRYWHEAGNILSWINGGLEREWGPMQIKDHRVYLPNGAPVIYDTLSWHHQEEGEELQSPHWRLKLRKGWTKMYGAKLVENVVQALARMVMSQACARIATSFKPVLSSHDEWSFLVKDDDHKDEALEYITNEMKRTPAWLPGIPLDCEGGLGERYSK